MRTFNRMHYVKKEVRTILNLSNIDYKCFFSFFISKYIAVLTRIIFFISILEYYLLTFPPIIVDSI